MFTLGSIRDRLADFRKSVEGGEQKNAVVSPIFSEADIPRIQVEDQKELEIVLTAFGISVDGETPPERKKEFLKDMAALGLGKDPPGMRLKRAIGKYVQRIGLTQLIKTIPSVQEALMKHRSSRPTDS